MDDYENSVVNENNGDNKSNQEETEKNPVYAEVPEEKHHSRNTLDQISRRSSTVYEEEMNEVPIPESYSSRQEKNPTPVILPARLPSREGATTSELPTTIVSKTTREKGTINLSDRDPHNLQEAIIVDFEDIIAEPRGTHSFNTVWETSYTVYIFTKFWLYRVLSVVFGIPCALFWGIYFALLAFFGVWWIVPCIRAISIKLHYIGKLYSLVIRIFCDPIFESIALVFSRVKVKLGQD